MKNKEPYVNVEELKKNIPWKSFQYENDLIENAIDEALAKCQKYSRKDIAMKAEWVEGGVGWKCSSCGYSVKPYNATYFCPNCGCAMKNGC